MYFLGEFLSSLFKLCVYIQVVLRRWHSSFFKVWHIFQEGIWEPPLSPFYRFADYFDLANTLPVLKRLITSPALLPTSFLTYHVFTRMPGDSYRSCFGSLLLCPPLYVRRLSSTINSPWLSILIQPSLRRYMTPAVINTVDIFAYVT